MIVKKIKNKELVLSYRDNVGINSSSLKHIFQFTKFKDSLKSMGETYKTFFGNIVDFALSQDKEGVKEYLKDFYFIQDKHIPEGKMKTLLNILYEKSKNKTIADFNDDELIEVKKSLSFGRVQKKGDKMDAFLANIRSFEPYLKALKSDKVVLSQSVFNNALKASKELISYFDKLGGYFIAQLPIYHEIDGVACKILLDLVHISDDNVINLIDTKTTAELDKFNQISYQLKYPFQGYFYYHVFSHFQYENGKIVLEDGEIDITDYTLKCEFQFIVIDHNLEIDKYGLNCDELGYGIDGDFNKYSVNKSIEEYKFYLENGFSSSKYFQINKFKRMKK